MSDSYYSTEYYYVDTPRIWFSYSITDVVLNMVLGSISALASILVLMIIFQSSVKFTSAYHRIMALISTFDILFSLSFALSTLPIPKSLVPYRGPTLGTYGTCTAQAISLNIGGSVSIDATLCLVWYYVCVALRVSEDKIMKVYIPIFFTYIILIAIISSVIGHEYGLWNIQHWSPHCGPSPIPSSCWNENGPPDGVDCLWPTSPHPYFTLKTVSETITIATFCLIITGLAIVIFVVCLNEKKLKMNDTNEGHSSNQLTQTRLIMSQAVMYIIAYLVTWVLVLVPWDENVAESVDVLESVLVPLQGLWNMFIFVYFKILQIRKSDGSIVSNCAALKILLLKPKDVPEMVLSGMEEVKIEDRFSEDCESNPRETGSSSNFESQYTSNPSAYDGLSHNTRPVGSQCLSALSKLDHSDSHASSLKKTLSTFYSPRVVKSLKSSNVLAQEEGSEGLSYEATLSHDENIEGLSYGSASTKGISVQSYEDQLKNT